MAQSTIIGKPLYVLRNDNVFWFTTIRRNRKDCWESVKPYAQKYTQDKRWKKRLKDEGWRCVPVLIQEITKR